VEIRNRDWEWYQINVAGHRDHQEDWLRTGYAAPGYYLKDFCLLEAGGEFHVYYILGTPGVQCCTPGNEIMIGHATTASFTRYATHQPCLYLDIHGWDNAHVFCPFVVARDGRYYMFYCGAPLDNTQRIGLAVSDDLFNFRRVTDRPVIRPEEYDWAYCPTERGAACRDPHVNRMGEEYWMYYTALTKDGKGCVARAISRDLIEWRDAGTAYVGPSDCQCESANVQEMDGKWHMFFMDQDKLAWMCLVSDSPERWAGEPIEIAPALTAMEVIRRRDPRWLVCYFRFDPMKLFVGVIDWAETPARIKEVHDPAELAEFGLTP